MVQTATVQFQYYPECTVLHVGATSGSRSFRCCHGAPDRPNSLLLYKDKDSAKSSRFNAYQLTFPAVQTRIQL